MRGDDALQIKTYSLSEVAKVVLPPEMKDGVRWLSRRLNRGELSGYRVGRTWRMTREDVEDLIEPRRKHPLPRVVQEPRTDVVSGLTPTSRLRLMRSAS
jgi:excisionase family DNA binding protein